MKIIHVFTFSLCLTLASSYLLPKTPPPIRPRVKPLVLPEAFQRQGHKLQSGLRIPNAKFCQEMTIQPFRHYMVLPWWYSYCERLMEKQEKRIIENKLYLPQYGRLLQMAQAYKKQQKKRAWEDAAARQNHKLTLSQI